MNTAGQENLFATRWSLALLIGLAVYLGHQLINPHIVQQFDLLTRAYYAIPVYYGPAVLLLLALFALHRRLCFADIRFFGDVQRKDLLRGILAVSLLYIAASVIALGLGQPREPTMVSLYDLKTPTQNLIMVLSLLVLPPIVEELLFRHFLLSVLPFKTGIKIATSAAIITALAFAAKHSHYEYFTTYALLFALGIVFAWSRIRSDGVALPIALHSYAVAFALICDQVIARIQG